MALKKWPEECKKLGMPGEVDISIGGSIKREEE